MASNPIPKFSVGQVVWCWKWNRYAKVTTKWIEAVGELKLVWRYNIYYQDTQSVRDVSESEIRKLTKKERGRDGKE